MKQNIVIYATESLYFSERDQLTGLPGVPVEMGESDTLTVALASEDKEFKNTRGEVVQSIPMPPTVTLTAGIKNISVENMALGVKGKVVEVVAGTATAVVVNAPAIGQVAFLGLLDVSNVVLNKAGTPLVEGVDYTVNTKFGKVIFLKAQNGDITISFDNAAQKGVGLLTDSSKEFTIRAEVVDIGTDKASLVEFYRCKPSPLKELSFSGGDFAGITLEIKVLADLNKPVDALYGRFGRVIS
jgi:hypothetical protein